MAQRVQVILEDDVDGGPADETVRFSVEGVSYEIDLSSDNASKLREEFAAWIGHGRRTGGRKSNGAKSKRDSGDVREWLRTQGHTVSERGRISKELQDLYDASH